MNRAERICASVAAAGVVFTTIHKFFPEDRGDRHPTLSLRTIARDGGDRSQQCHD
jgi:type I restriction enzyme, R subunit